MPQAMEYNQTGRREALADLIANVESDATPFTSLLEKRKKPGKVVQDWQVRGYKRKGHKGVRDGQDAVNFDYNGRDLIHAVSQKFWDPRGVSDFAEESDVAGAKKGELADQIADAYVTIKQTMERRFLSNEECALQDASDPTGANETRGVFKWLDTAAQTLYPVPDRFRPNAAQLYTGTLANWTESTLKSAARAAWKRRLGNSVKLKMVMGIDAKSKVSEFTRYDDTVANKESVRVFNQDAADRAVVEIIDRMVLDTGTLDLIASAHILTDPNTGEDTASTHLSYAAIDMDMMGVAYTRMPRQFELPYAGGGYKIVIDSIAMLMVDNPVGCFSGRIAS